MSTLTPEQLAFLKHTLLELQQDLDSQYQLGKSAGDTVPLDQSKFGRLSRMDALQQQKIAESSSNNIQQRLRNITQALERLKIDDYGFCKECGEEITFARLNIQPEAEYCIQCQSQIEHQ